MVRRTTFLLLSLTALLLLQFADCMFAMTPDEQSMQCCGSLPCDPSNQSHDCCKGMVSAQPPSLLPAAHVTLHVPVIVMVDAPRLPLIAHVSEAFGGDLAELQHSPPELYTLHSSFLI